MVLFQSRLTPGYTSWWAVLTATPSWLWPLADAQGPISLCRFFIIARVCARQQQRYQAASDVDRGSTSGVYQVRTWPVVQLMSDEA